MALHLMGDQCPVHRRLGDAPQVILHRQRVEDYVELAGVAARGHQVDAPVGVGAPGGGHSQRGAGGEVELGRMPGTAAAAHICAVVGDVPVASMADDGHRSGRRDPNLTLAVDGDAVEAGWGQCGAGGSGSSEHGWRLRGARVSAARFDHLTGGVRGIGDRYGVVVGIVEVISRR